MTEFELIQRFFTGMPKGADVALGVGDDCALVRLNDQDHLAISTDTLVEGRHFPEHYPPGWIAARALGSAASDLAAMGATPVGCLLALTLPQADSEWLSKFSEAFRSCAERWSIPLLGGDTTGGRLQLTVTVLGRVDVSRVLLRSGASAGEDLWVSGKLGEAAGALKYRLADPESRYDFGEQGPISRLLDRYDMPAPRLALGQWLLGRASAAIDISDGLVADVGHLCRLSGVGAEIQLESLPVSESLSLLYSPHDVEKHALYGGDDYELCFSAPVHLREELSRAPYQLSRIGHLTVGHELILRREGKAVKPSGSGFDHFGLVPGGHCDVI